MPPIVPVSSTPSWMPGRDACLYATWRAASSAKQAPAYARAASSKTIARARMSRAYARGCEAQLFDGDRGDERGEQGRICACDRVGDLDAHHDQAAGHLLAREDQTEVLASVGHDQLVRRDREH